MGVFQTVYECELNIVREEKLLKQVMKVRIYG